MKPVLCLVNALAELRPEQTTSLLVHGASARVNTWLAEVDDLDVCPDGEIVARARPVHPAANPAATLSAIARAQPQVVALDHPQVLVRTNPARDPRRWAHEHALGLLREVERRGGLVCNRADGLTAASSKRYLSTLPAHVRPATFISADPAVLHAWVCARSEPTVLKPIEGTQGRDVFRVDAHTVNLNQILAVLCRQGVVMAQAFVPEAQDGDVRVLLLDGQILEVDGQVAAVRRRPGAGDFRSNIAAGGRAEFVAVSAEIRAACAAIGPRLRADGLRFVGADFVGALLVEANVYSPGGLFDAGRFTQTDFVGPVLDALLD